MASNMKEIDSFEKKSKLEKQFLFIFWVLFMGFAYWAYMVWDKL